MFTEERYDGIEEALSAVLGEFNDKSEVGQFFGGKYIDVCNYCSGRRGISKGLRKEILKKFPYLKRQRHRMTLSFESEEQKQRFIDWCHYVSTGDTPTNTCRLIADSGGLNDYN